MKKNIIYLAVIFTVMTMLISATVKEASSPCDSPLVGDHSGAPGETNCSACHSSPVNPNSPDLHFEVENGSSNYQLDSTYLVHIRIKRAGHSKFGFVCSALDTTNTSVGTFSLVNVSNTRTYTLGGRKYVSHTPCGADSQDSAMWTYRWKAPSTDKGKVKIYMSMLVANHDEALTGDTTYTRILQINSPSVTGIKEINQQLLNTKVFPTVFNDRVTVVLDPRFAEKLKTIYLHDIHGREIIQVSTTSSDYQVNELAALSPGTYLMKVEYASQQQQNFKLIKQ